MLTHVPKEELTEDLYTEVTGLLAVAVCTLATTYAKPFLSILTPTWRELDKV